MAGTFSKLNPEHKLFRELVKRNPVWWRNLRENPEIYIEIRKNNYIDIYYNGGRVMNLTYTNKFNGKIHFEYIPLKSQNNYVPLDLMDDSASIQEDDLAILGINNFCSDELNAIQKRMRGFYPPSSEKGIQASFVLNNSQFIDSEFQYEDKIRFDLIWADVLTRKLYVVELKTIGDQRLYVKEDRVGLFNDNKIDFQLHRYRDFVVENKSALLSHYQNVFAVKKNLGILRPPLLELESLGNFIFEERPILLVGDCTQEWIDKQANGLNQAIKNVAFGGFYQGSSTRKFYIPESDKGNKYVFV